MHDSKQGVGTVCKSCLAESQAALVPYAVMHVNSSLEINTGENTYHLACVGELAIVRLARYWVNRVPAEEEQEAVDDVIILLYLDLCLIK